MPYQGSEKVYMGDGTGLAIQHIGNNTLISPYTNKLLRIKNLLHVPNMNKNLLSVAKFAQDKQSYIL